MDLGNVLKKARLRKNLTLVELAEQSGVTGSYLSQVERGTKGSPSDKILARLSKALDLPIILLQSEVYQDLISEAEVVSTLNFINAQSQIKELEISLDNLVNQFPTEDQCELYNWLQQHKIVEKGFSELKSSLSDYLGVIREWAYPEHRIRLFSELMLLDELGVKFIDAQIKVYRNVLEHTLKATEPAGKENTKP